MPKKFSTETKEIAKNLYAVSGNCQDVAEKVGTTEATIRNWAKNWKKDPEFSNLCNEKKAGFAEKADEIIDSGLCLLKRRFERALKFEDELDEVLDEIVDKGELAPPTVRSISSSIKALQIQKVSEITTAVGTLYDKRALSKGEMTENVSVEIKLPDGVDEYAE